MDRIDRLIIDSLKTKEIIIKTIHDNCSWKHLPDSLKTGYMTQPVKTLANAKALWDIFGEVPINDKDEIVEEFLWFKKGTDRFHIWHWFEDFFEISVYDDLMFADENEMPEDNPEPENELMLPFEDGWLYFKTGQTNAKDAFSELLEKAESIGLNFDNMKPRTVYLRDCSGQDFDKFTIK